MKNVLTLFFFIYLTAIGLLFAQENAGPPEDTPDKEQKPKPDLKIDLPFFDFPYQTDTMNAMGYGFFNTYSSLSMNQSMAMTTNVYSAMHYGLKKLNDSLDIPKAWKNIIYYGGTAVGILAFAYVLPFGYPWLGSEYTHSVLSCFGIDSFNGDYSFNLSGVIGVTDSALIRFKDEAPYNFIRMNSAKIEAYNLFSNALISKYFYYNLNDLSWITALVSTVIVNGNFSPVILYDIKNMTGVVFNDVEQDIEDMYKKDKTQETRPLIGLAVLNWGYELFHPNEPYAARGLHPSGDSSVARYIRFNQFSDDEMKYLIKHSYLNLLNFVSPLLYGFRGFPLGNSGLEGNFALRHYLTSFGTDITASVFLKKKPFNMAFTYHSYQNYENYFPAIEAELVDYPLAIGKLEMFLSPRILVGMQPKDQVFKTSDPEFLGLFGLRVDFKAHKNIFPYLDFTAKTKGWVAGNGYLNANVSVATGVSLRF